MSAAGAIGSLKSLPPPPAARHDAQLYTTQGFLLKSVAAYLGEGLRRGEALIVIAVREHWTALRSQLAAEGARLDAATRARRVIVLDAEQALSWIQVGGKVDEGAFRGIVGGAFGMAADAPVRAYGEMVDLLWNGGRAPSALILERLWNAFLAVRPASLLCAYRMDCAQDAEGIPGVDAICAAHDRVAPADADAAPESEAKTG